MYGRMSIRNLRFLFVLIVFLCIQLVFNLLTDSVIPWYVTSKFVLVFVIYKLFGISLSLPSSTVESHTINIKKYLFRQKLLVIQSSLLCRWSKLFENRTILKLWAEFASIRGDIFCLFYNHSACLYLVNRKLVSFNDIFILYI